LKMLNNSKPIVSIIIPVLDREKIIHETLQSIRNQTLERWECLVVDDGSTDGTIAVVDSYGKEDNRFKLFKNNKIEHGASVCRNIGIKQSQGKYIVFIDSDDLFSHDALEKRVGFMELNPNLDFAVFPCLRFKNSPYDQNILLSSYKGKDVLTLFLKRDIPWGTLNVIYQRKSILNNEIFWDPKIRIHQDIEFHVKAVCRGLRFEMPDTDPDCFWREHGEKNPNHNRNLGKKIQSNIDLLNSIVNELVCSNNFSNENKVILSRLFLVETLKDAIFVREYKLFGKMIVDLYLLKVISGFDYYCCLLLSIIRPISFKTIIAKIFKKILIVRFGNNEIKYYLNVKRVNREK
jgi:glycosyltransferase involved in cell wall biosynthesis